jgi:hypothetical protein
MDEAEATNPETPPTSKNTQKSNINVDEADPAQLLKEMYVEVTTRLDNIEKRVENIEEEMTQGDVEVHNPEMKILEKRPESERRQLLQSCKSSGADGLPKSAIANICEVSQDRARKISKKAGKQYHYLEHEYPGGPYPSKLYHKGAALADKIGDLDPKGRNIREVFDKVGIENPIEMTKEEIANLKEQKQKIEKMRGKYDDSEEMKSHIRGIF